MDGTKYSQGVRYVGRWMERTSETYTKRLHLARISLIAVYNTGQQNMSLMCIRATVRSWLI